MLEVTGDHVARLNDADLRRCVAKLCEAELSRAGLPRSSVTAGGLQEAKDGGVDVRVELPVGTVPQDFVPRAVTGFQVKCADLPPRKIAGEMWPKGKLREAIRALAEKGGAYIIVSSKGSVADRPLEERRTAMRLATADLVCADQLHMDFYDRERLAVWVNDYPGVALWVRDRIGESLSGWKGISDIPSGDVTENPYRYDDTLRLRVASNRDARLRNVVEGIAVMRKTLSEPGGVVRLIGLAGTGKTRLAQALFDPHIGEKALDPEFAVYIDQGLEPDQKPSAREMLDRLVCCSAITY